MEYNVHNLFPIPVLETILDGQLISDEINLIKSNLQKKGALHNNNNNYATEESFVLDNWNLHELKKSIMKTLELFSKEVLNYEYEKLYITQSWINVNPPGSWHHYHNHSNSILSGVFYIQTEKDCGDINFYKPIREIEPSIKFDENNYFTWSRRYFSPLDNQLLIFPSNLFHEVSQNLTKDTNRISLSFNSFMNPIGSKESKTFLSIK